MRRTDHRQSHELSTNVCPRGEIGIIGANSWKGPQCFEIRYKRQPESNTIWTAPWSGSYFSPQKLNQKAVIKNSKLGKLNTLKICLFRWTRPGRSSNARINEHKLGVRSCTEYNVENRRHPMRLADDRIANQDNEPGIVRTTDAPPTAMPPAVVMQRPGERNLNRYKPLKSSIISQSEHTIKLSDGAVLRKSGVALKRTNNSKKRGPGWVTAPPKPCHLKRKLLANRPSSSKGTTGKQKNAKSGITRRTRNRTKTTIYHWRRKHTRSKNPGTNIEGKRHEHLMGDNKRRRQQFDQALTRRRRRTFLHERRKLKQTGGRTTRREKIERKRSATRLKRRNRSEIPQTESKKSGSKQRLVSYSSQDSTSLLDETSSRRS